MRVETIGDATIYLADCRDVLSMLGPVDCVLSDVPCGQGVPWWPDDPADYPALVQSIMGAMPAYKVAAITQVYDRNWHPLFPSSAVEFDPANFPQFRKPPRGDIPGAKRLLYMGTPSTGERVKPAPRPYMREAMTHPAQGWLPEWKYLVDVFSATGETVLDPFMGSGTTGVAALEMGRKFIGIELIPDYFDQALTRIRARVGA